MPIYRYRCPAGHEFEVTHSMLDPGPDVCDEHAEPVRRVLSAPNVSWQGKSPGLEDFWASGNPEDIPSRGAT